MQLRIPVKAHVKTFLEHPMNLGKGGAGANGERRNLANGTSNLQC
jgi:hypothetical protein